MPLDDECYELIHLPTGIAVARRVIRARGFLGNGLGLIGRRALPPDEGLWLTGTGAIHTFGMRFALDVLFLDREGRTVDVVPHLAPNRVCCRRGAHWVIELAAGALTQVPQITTGVSWLLTPAGGE